MLKTTLVLFVTISLWVLGDADNGGLCPPATCPKECRLETREGLDCPYCECQKLCEDIRCGQGMICREFKRNSNASYVAKCVDPDLPLECQLPPDPSLCRASIKKWYYNTDMDTCQEFTYGGCLGNANNFDTRSECAAKCIDRERQKVCPQVMCAMWCEHGFLKNEDGCDICKCREEKPVPPNCNNTIPQCKEECPQGYLHKKDSQGCPTCECQLPDQCPKARCRRYCQFGFRRDENGCEICECMDNPCKNMMCSGGEVCETVPRCPRLPHSRCHYYPKCSASYTINRIRVQLIYEHQRNKKTECKDLIQIFVRKVKERFNECLEDSHADIGFIEASPENDILHVTLHVSNRGEKAHHLVRVWSSVEGQLKNDMNSFTIDYHGHIFTPRRESLVTSYFSKEHPEPQSYRYFLHVLTVIACIIGLCMMAFIFAVRARKFRKPPASKRINIIYRPAPEDLKPLYNYKV